MTLEGILPVWKPENFTSHDVVAKVRRLLGIKRIGHTGTLDPMVTGVLPLCIGRATRMVEYLQELPKQYEAVLLIGIATDTEDMSGTVIERSENVDLTESRIREVIGSFVGEMEQVPPMYSAVKVDGKRLYELAREGKEVERKSRKVTIYDLEILNVDVHSENPQIHFRVTCSKGTYIRTLCVDIGKTLGYPAAMKSLIRTATGHIRADQCLSFEQIEQMKSDGTLDSHLIAMDQAISHIPALHVTDQEAKSALQGQKLKIQSERAERAGMGQIIFRTYGPDERFLGLFEWNRASQSLVPVKVFM